MSALPITLSSELTLSLGAAFDREGKIVRALESLGPVADRDVLVVDAPDGSIREGLVGLRSRCSDAALVTPLAFDAPPDSIDVVVALWSAFRGVNALEVAEADRVLRGDGRLLIVHDYGRDDVSHLVDLSESIGWARPGGPFLGAGFRVRVIHCWWSFETIDEMHAFLDGAFGERGRTFAETLRRPRLAHKIAIYHRSRPAA